MIVWTGEQTARRRRTGTGNDLWPRRVLVLVSFPDGVLARRGGPFDVPLITMSRRLKGKARQKTIERVTARRWRKGVTKHLRENQLGFDLLYSVGNWLSSGSQRGALRPFGKTIAFSIYRTILEAKYLELRNGVARHSGNKVFIFLYSGGNWKSAEVERRQMPLNLLSLFRSCVSRDEDTVQQYTAGESIRLRSYLLRWNWAAQRNIKRGITAPLDYRCLLIYCHFRSYVKKRNGAARHLRVTN